MKLLLMALTLFASVSASAKITDARFNKATGKIEVDVAYSGCSQRKFELKVGGCFESLPVRCNAKLIDVSGRNELCQGFFEHTVEFSLEEAGLNDDYYSEASIAIQGAPLAIRLPR